MLRLEGGGWLSHRGSETHLDHRTSRDRQRGVLEDGHDEQDSRNVRVSILAPGGHPAFSVWGGGGNVVRKSIV